ncbi:hypothetical protein RND81_14G134000 [Saponaria officinalis]|uniref:Uncharacterized protein n=1 Tax=Saponaria officinalis TaxID=3572 RepID=A0AAW1GPI2_SAPOF
MSCKFSLILFFIAGGLLVSLSYQDELETFSRKHAAPRPRQRDRPLPLNKGPVPQLRENNQPVKGHKHPKENDKSSVKGDPKLSHDHEPETEPRPRKTEPTAKRNKVRAPAEKPAKPRGNKTVPAGESRNHMKRPSVPKDGLKGCKKPSAVKCPVSEKKHQCRLRSV